MSNISRALKKNAKEFLEIKKFSLKAQQTNKLQSVEREWGEGREIEIKKSSRILSRETKKQKKQKVVKSCECSNEKAQYVSNLCLKRK